MAIQYSQNNPMSGRIDYTPLQQGMERMQTRRAERLAAESSELMNNFWTQKMNALQNAAFSDVSDWGPEIQETLAGLSNAGTALVQFKNQANALGNRAYNLMSSQGAFNPLTFKQQYDQMIANYIPTIEAKLENFKVNKGWSDRDMQRYLNSPGNENIRSFLLDHGDPAGNLKQLAKPVTPRGFIGGMGTEIYEDPLRYGLLAGGPALYGGARAAAKGGMGQFAPGALKGVRDMMQPLNVFGFGQEGGARNWWRKSLLDPAAKRAFKNDPTFQLRLADKHVKPGLQKAIKGINKDNKVVKDLLTKVNKKKGTVFVGGPEGTKISSQADIYRLKASDLGKKAQGKGDVAKDLRKQFVGKTKADLEKMASKNADKLKSIGGTGKKNLISNIKKIVDKKGIGWVMRQVAKKGGVKIGARALLGTLLSGSGIGTAVGVGMNLYTLYEIYNLLEKGLKETGGVRAPSKMLFGGRSKTDSPVPDNSFLVK